MQAAHEKKIPDDEIDIRSIAAKVYSFITYPFYLLFSNGLTSLCFIVLGILVALILRYSLVKTYTSSFILKPIDKHEKVHLNMLGDIQMLLKYKDYRSIGSELGLDSLTSRKIIDLTVTNPSVKSPLDSINITEVTITTSDYNQFIPIQNALLNYLENNPYFAKIKTLQKQQITLELQQAEKDIAQLDSLKAIQLRTYGKNTSQSQLLLNEPVDATAFYTAQMDRVNKKTILLARTLFVDNFQLIKGCVMIRQSTFPPRFLILCAYAIPASLLLAVFFLHFRNRRKENSPAAPNRN